MFTQVGFRNLGQMRNRLVFQSVPNRFKSTVVFCSFVAHFNNYYLPLVRCSAFTVSSSCECYEGGWCVSASELRLVPRLI